MSNVINTNVKSIMAQNALVTNNRSLENSMQQLSTGKRINSAADDAAGLAISERMTSQIRGLNQAVRNANDGISMLQTSEGALIETTNMLQRMRELAVQSATGSIDSTQRGYLNQEYQQLAAEIGRISDKTTWNGMALNDGRFSATPVKFQIGAGANDTVSVAIKNMDVTAGNLITAGVGAVDTVTKANTAISAMETALGNVATQRATLGAAINRLQYAADNLANVSMNTSASRSRILDTDYAQATTNLARTQIIQQAATAMLAQANQQPQTVLALLK
jgi:flagellin